MYGANHGVRTMVAESKMRGRPSIVMSASSSPGCDASISWRCSSALQCLGRGDDAAHQQVLVAVGLCEVTVQLGEELTVLALAQGFVDEVLAAREQPVDGRPGAAGLVRDVVDRDLGHPPALAARLHGVEHTIFEGEVDDDPRVRHT